MAAAKVLDTGTVAGYSLSIFSLLSSMILEFGHLNPDLGTPFLTLSALLIIFGGTFGATMTSFPIEETKKLPTLIKIAFFGEKHEPEELIDTIVKLAELARREGVLALENKSKELKETYPMLSLGFRYVVDGQSPERLKEILAEAVYAMEERHSKGIAYVNGLGGFAPTMGVVGTVCGLIGALALAGQGGDSKYVVGAIATAFIATFYGVMAANILFLPLASKLQQRSQEEVFFKLVQAHAVLGIQDGHNPRTLGSELRVYFRKSDLREDPDE